MDDWRHYADNLPSVQDNIHATLFAHSTDVTTNHQQNLAFL